MLLLPFSRLITVTLSTPTGVYTNYGTLVKWGCYDQLIGEWC
jgi:hypothetical protein